MSFPEPKEDVIAELVHRVQMHTLTRRIRLQEFFRDSDKLRCGRCTEDFFSRGLINAGLKLSEAEMQALIEHYTDHGPKSSQPATVSYSKFCADIDEIFTSDEKQEGMMSGMMTSSPGSTIMSTFVPNSIEDEEQFSHVLHRVAMLCKVQGIHLKTVYGDFDRSLNPTPAMMCPRRSGKVTKVQFVKKWPFKKEISDEEFELICERFLTKSGDIHFMALHNEVSEVLPAPEQPFPTSLLYLRPDHAEWSHAEISAVDRIRAKVAEKRMRMKEFFKDFDPLRKGFCSPGQLKTVFTIMNLSKEISKGDFEQLLNTYMRDDGYFHYQDFVNDVDSAFTMPGLEKNPLAMIDMPDPATTSPARRSTIRLTPSKEMQIGRVEDKIRTFVFKRRTEMKPTFMDFDRAHRGYISRSQFSRVMATMGLDLDEQAIGLLCNSYCDYGNHNDFNYKRFLKKIDPPASEVEVAMLEMTSPFVAKGPRPYFDKRGKVLKKVMSAPML